MPTEIIRNASFLISAISFLGMAVLFGDSLLLRFDLKTFLKSLGFLLLTGASIINLFNHQYTQISIWLFVAGFLLIFVGFIIDSHSILKLSFPIPLVLLFILRDHLLLFFLGGFIAASVFQLVYTTKHRDLIPLGVGFVLIAAGEYLYSLESMSKLAPIADAGSFLYLLSCSVLLLWLWAYLALRVVYLFKSG